MLLADPSKAGQFSQMSADLNQTCSAVISEISVKRETQKT